MPKKVFKPICKKKPAQKLFAKKDNLKIMTEAKDSSKVKSVQTLLKFEPKTEPINLELPRGTTKDTDALPDDEEFEEQKEDSNFFNFDSEVIPKRTQEQLLKD